MKVKIVVLSDTHVPKRAKSFPPRLLVELQTADAIIHAGDLLNTAAYRELCTFGTVHAVYGNADEEELKHLLPRRLLLDMNSFKIGVVHGHEGKGSSTERRALNAFKDEHLDCLIFGHSHIPVKKQDKGLLIFNPGSPTDKRRQPRFSFGLINIGETLQAEHVFFKKGSY
ncbi:metallophosphoesterase family protein [Bacillus sp. SJS]|uniref:metallophosphoesterase family protein n=1 Tax=Bacillus sp. SJS TaxID=1423321 RepID=UPI002F90AD2D